MTHKCNDGEDEVFSKRKKKQIKSSKIGKDITHYLHRHDFESDVHTWTHKPNHVDADILTVGDTPAYNDCKRNTFPYSGYGSIDKFCSWLFTDDHSHSTVIAYNQDGYDGRFIQSRRAFRRAV